MSQLCKACLKNRMSINVAQLLKEPTGSSRSYRVVETVDKDNVGLAEGEVTLTRTNRSLLLRGELTAGVTGLCSRCLKQFHYLVSFTPEEEFFPTTDILPGVTPTDEPDSSTAIDESNILDLSEVIRQYTLLAVPAKPLCRPDCAGLCPTCGHDLNQGRCLCPAPIADQGLSKLVRLGKERKT